MSNYSKIRFPQIQFFPKSFILTFHFPKSHFPQIPLSQNAIFPKCNFPKISVSQNLIFQKSHIPKISFSLNLIFPKSHFPKSNSIILKILPDGREKDTVAFYNRFKTFLRDCFLRFYCQDFHERFYKSYIT